MVLDKKQSKELINKLFTYMEEEFPLNAKSWNQSTDELPTIGYWIAEELQYNKYSKVLTGISNTPALRNRKWHNFIKQNVTKLNEYALTELAARFGDWLKFESKLFENQQIDNNLPKKNLDFMVNKSKQFELESGIIFENLIDSKNPNMKISLAYHVNNSTNFDEFIASIDSFIGTQDAKLSDIDISKLEIHVNKYK